jgi:signal transduction histidine kinase
LAATLHRHPTAADAAFAAVLSAAALVSVYATLELLRQDPAFKEPAKPGILLAVLAVMIPLALRRRFPLAVACTVIGAFVVGRLVSHPDIPVLAAWEGTMTVWACWIALYSAVVHGRTSRRMALVVFVLAAVVVGEVVREVFFYGGGAAYGGLPVNQAVLLAYNVVSIALPIGLGMAVRSRRDRESELAERTRELQSEREENARSAVLEERVRIARELHDVVAHHVSVMGVQAGAARRVMAQQPAKAEEVLSSIEDSSRQAVLELHRLLGVLRRADQPDELTPQPDLAQLPELVAKAGQAGLTVELSIEGEPRALPRTLEVSAYRVIQEALTNALRHSGGTTATVRLDYRRAVLEVEVLDDGTGNGSSPDAVGGHGLMGMRERVGLHGGHLRAGRTPQGGFAIHATFPFNGGAP